MIKLNAINSKIDAILFGEDQSRIIITCQTKNVKTINLFLIKIMSTTV